MEQDSSWVDLLSDHTLNPTGTTHCKRSNVRVTESTPVQSRARSIWNKVSKDELEMLTNQVSLLLSENKSLKTALEQFSNKELFKQLQETQSLYQTARIEQDQQAEVITKLMADNERLIHQVESVWGDANSLNPDEEILKEKEEIIEGLMSHIQSLREAFQRLSDHCQSSSPSSTSHLLEDLVRLTHKNADLCDTLAATQYSRSFLEREILKLKRTILEERSKSNGTGCTEHVEKSFMEENDKLKKDLKQMVIEKEQLKVISSSQEKQLKFYASDITNANNEIKKLRQNQLAEIDQRCKEVDYLKQQFSEQLNSIQLDHDEYSQKLSDVTLENNVLLSKISELEEVNSQLSKELASETAKLVAKDGHLKRVTEQMDYKNAALQLRLAEVQRKFDDEFKEIGVSRGKLEEELKSHHILLDDTLSQLESSKTSNAMLKQQLGELRREIDVSKRQLSSLSELNSEMKLMLEQRSSRIVDLESEICKINDEKSSSLNDLFSVSMDNPRLVLSSSHHQSYDLNNRIRHTDIFHLRQRLTDSRQVCVRLEVQLAQLQTDNAKLTGSYQALLSLQEKLTDENTRALSNCRTLYHEKECLLNDREILLSSIDEMSNEALHLSAELTAAKDELNKVSEMCRRKNQELESYSLKIVDATIIQEELNHVMPQVHSLYSKVNGLHKIMEEETKKLDEVTSISNCEIVTNQQELSDLEENSIMCGNVNSTRSVQIEECNEVVSKLQGELEVMHARKIVLLCLAAEDRCCGSQVTTVGKLKMKLKLQRKQTNFLRVKLGYTLSELRLYKQLKITCDQQLCELQSSLTEVQKQYNQCRTQLGAAEEHLL